MSDEIAKAILGAMGEAEALAGESYTTHEQGDLERAVETQGAIQAASLIKLAEIAGSLARIEKMLEPLAELANKLK